MKDLDHLRGNHHVGRTEAVAEFHNRTISSVRFENEIRDLGVDEAMLDEAVSLWDQCEGYAMSDIPREDWPCECL